YGASSDVRLLYAEARVLRALKWNDEAAGVYRQILQLKPSERAAETALLALLTAGGKRAEALAQIDQAIVRLPGDDPDYLADLTGNLLDLGDLDRAGQLSRLALARTPEHQRTLDYAAQIALLRDGEGAAIVPLQRAQAQAGLATPVSSLRQSAETGRLVLEQANAPLADAPSSGQYERIAEMLDQNGAWLASAVDQKVRSGTAGTSRLRSTEIPLEWKKPLDGKTRLFVRGDVTHMDAGRLDLADPAQAERFGSAMLCEPLCTDVLKQSVSGLALSAGVERGPWKADLGTTPLGFKVRTLVGGVTYKGDLGPLGYSVEASRRALSGSVLSYAGAVDPNTGKTWGGVTANGVRLGASLDQGGLVGGWASLGVHRLIGKNVLRNDRAQLMSGVVVRAINRDDVLLGIGLTGMLWRHSENAGEYTFGHGGYYSPEKYKSLSLPVTFAQRIGRLSYAVRGAVSRSRSETRAADYFPTDGALQARAALLAEQNFTDARYDGGSGKSRGHALSIAVEYQVTPRLFAGARAELDRSPDYSPNRALLYFRYSLDRASARPVDLLPQAVYPSSQN
ncbi:MAG TPA: cellulose synthase subunit BcsC-related outer membrane protein, partial [Burkholderiaceae bacterium]